MERIRYCVLAKSIPEYSKRDGTLYTCSIGYSPQKGLIRVYPLPIKSMNKWEVWEMPIEKNKRDTRIESWKLASYSRKEDFIGLDEDAKCVGLDVGKSSIKYLSDYIYPSISRMNELRVSVGLIKADHVKPYWKANERYIDTQQYGMFDDVEIADFARYTKDTKDKEARIKFRDMDGLHDLQLNTWGVYEYARKFKADNGAFRFIGPGKDEYLLLGNMHSYRNNWIALEMFNLTSINQQILF